MSTDEHHRKDFHRQYNYAKTYLILMLEPCLAVPLKNSTVVEIGSNVGGTICAYSEVAKEAIGIEIHEKGSNLLHPMPRTMASKQGSFINLQIPFVMAIFTLILLS